MPDPVPTDELAPPQAAEGVRFPVSVPGFEGSLEQLVIRVQRGDIDVSTIEVSQITGAYRRRFAGESSDDLREIADFLTLAARLVALKAQRLLPEGGEGGEDEEEIDEGTEAGRRLGEYRLFKAAAEALLSDAAEEGARSFLSMVSPDVIPVERLRIPPERLAAAFRAVLERLADLEPLPVGAATFSVEEKANELRQRLSSGPIDFEAIFQGVGSRLEAVACFLALLELLKRGEAVVDQDQPFAPIRVAARG